MTRWLPLPLIAAVALLAGACSSSNNSGNAASALNPAGTAASNPVSTSAAPPPAACPTAPAQLPGSIPNVPPAPAGAQVQTTPSGLRYIDIKPGAGATPKQGQMVTVNYTGWLLNGTKFDSSLDRNQPFTFQIGTGQVIKGWDEGLSTMQVGGQRRLIIPAALAYGAQGQPPVIPQCATLIFDVQLLSTQ